MNSDSLRQSILSAVGQVAREFQRNPFLDLSECDIQSSLRSRLRELIPSTLPLHTSGCVSLIQSEYWKNGNWIDLVCLDPERAAKIMSDRTSERFDQYLWALPLFAGIEMKFVYHDDRRKGPDICLNDMKKLNDLSGQASSSFLWLVLCFIQNGQFSEQFVTLFRSHSTSEIDEFNKIYVIGPNNSYKCSS